MPTWKKLLATVTLAVVAIHILPARAVDKAPETTTLTFAIERKGEEIGRHRVSYTDGDTGDLAIEIDARIRVKFAFITVYKMDHAGRELWEGKQLVRMVTKTEKNSEHEKVELHAADNYYVVETAEGTRLAPLDIVPSSFTKPDFWIDEGEKDFLLLDTLSGMMRPSRLIAGDRTTLTLDGQAYDARFYQIYNMEKDRLSHEFWIDDAGYLVKGHLLTKDGESLYYTLTNTHA